MANNRIRRWVGAGAAASALVLGTVASPVVASTFTATPSGEASCISAFEHDSTPGGGTFTQTTTPITMHIKCYYDWDYSPGPTGIPSGTGPGWFTGATPPTSTEWLYVCHGTSSCGTPTPAGGAGPYHWTDFVVDVTAPAIGYVEFHFTLYRDSGTQSWNAANIGGFHVLASGGASDVWNLPSNSTNTDRVAWSEYEAATPANRWGDEYSPYMPFCHGTTVELDAPTTEETTVATGDTVHLTVDGGSVAGTEIQVRMPSPITSEGAEDWHVVRDSDYAGADPQTYSFVTGSMWPKKAKFLQVRCREPAGTWVQRVVTETGEGVVSDEPLERPCKSIDFYAPEQEVVELGDDTVWTFRYSRPARGDPTILDLEVRQAFPGGDFGTWESVDTDIEPPASEEYTVVADQSGDVDTWFHWRCQDAEGWWVLKAIIGGGFPGSPIGIDDSAAGCIESASFGLNPSSWVPGLLRSGTCLMSALWVPSDDALDELTARADEATEHVPISYVYETTALVAGVVTGAPEAITANETDCLVLLGESVGGTNDPFDGATYGFCEADDPAFIVTARAVQVWFFWVSFAFGMLMATKSVVFG